MWVWSTITRYKIFIFLFLESSKNQERSFQIFLNRSRNKNFYYQDPFQGENEIFLNSLLDNKPEARNTIQDLKRENYQESRKNFDNNSLEMHPFMTHSTNLCLIWKKNVSNSEINFDFFGTQKYICLPQSVQDYRDVG